MSPQIPECQRFLTLVAQWLHSLELTQVPAAFLSPSSKGLFFKSNHLSFFKFQNVRGSVVNWLLYRSNFCSSTSCPNEFGRLCNLLPLKSRPIKWRRAPKFSYTHGKQTSPKYNTHTYIILTGKCFKWFLDKSNLVPLVTRAYIFCSSK